jgi:hypothetical protein
VVAVTLLQEVPQVHRKIQPSHEDRGKQSMNSVRPLGKDEGYAPPVALVAKPHEGVARAKALVNADRASATGHQIASWEAFFDALSHVNALTRREDISVSEAKDTLTKAEALRAWASFDRRLTEEQKKDANRAMARTMLMLNMVAEREQPIVYLKGVPKRGGSKQPGPAAWLRRELQITKQRADFIRRFAADEDKAREIISVGAHWLTAISIKTKAGPNGVLANMGQWVRNSNSLMCATRVAPQYMPKELRRIREIIAWCESYESALVKLKARGDAGLKDASR